MHVLYNMVRMQEADPKLGKTAAETEARKKVLSWLQSTYKNLLGESGEEQRFAAYINTAVMEIDPHTIYMPPTDRNAFAARMSLRYFGVGMELAEENGEITIRRLVPGGSADQSGKLRQQDRIMAVSGPEDVMVPVSGMSVMDVSKMVRGDSGTVLRVLVSRKGMETEVELKRDVIRDMTNSLKAVVVKRTAAVMVTSACRNSTVILAGTMGQNVLPI